LDAEQLASKYSRDELESLAGDSVDDPDSYDTKRDLAEAMLEGGWEPAPPSTSFEAVNPEGMAVVNTPLNKAGLPDPSRVVTHAYRDDDGTVTYEGGDE
jgi:hypothetical protein